MAPTLAVPSAVLEEEARFEAEVAEVEAWWRTERFALTQRPYSARDVVSLRGTLPVSYPSNQMARKLWRLLRAHAAAGTASRTFGALDPVQAILMAPHLDSIYVSGWQCSSTHTSTNEPGPDLADYPYDTVPNKVHHLFMAQLFHDRKQREARAAMTPQQRAAAPPPVDFLRPIIADGDAGFGGATATAKLCKLFVERGAAGVHIEDQSASAKKCGHMAGKVLISTADHVSRLVAARLQFDIMAVDTLLVARTDAVAATLLQTNIDPRDHPFILGATNPAVRGRPLAALLSSNAGLLPPAELQSQEDAWLAEARLMTFAEAVSASLPLSSVPAFLAASSSASSLDHAKEIASKFGASDVFFDWDLPRTREGFYRFKGSVAAAVARASAFAPHADLVWMETSGPDLAECRAFSAGVKARHPHTMLAYNLSPSFNWDKAGMSDRAMAEFIPEIAKLGFCWQFITLAGFHANALAVGSFAPDFARRGMLAYVEGIQREERRHEIETLAHQKWSGANYYDRLLRTVQGGITSTAAMAKGVTEEQFEEEKGGSALVVKSKM
ncbi:isocitrate lyase-like [Wolffia australiana]